MSSASPANSGRVSFDNDVEKEGSANISISSVKTYEEVNDLKRKLNTRQISMIAISGVIGTGLFLGTGKSLATAGPASLFLAYTIMGVIVYLAMVALGEMTVYMPVAGSYGLYCSRFVDPAVGLFVYYNTFFGFAISTANDLVALQLVFEYWNIKAPTWSIAFIFWWVLLALNIVTVRAYGEAEYVLSILKIVAIVIFIILSIVVNVGGGAVDYLGFHYWYIDGAPFHKGFKGFASVFVTAAFAYGSTESIGVTAGETKNPARAMPRVVKTVFYRILIFYVLTVLLIGINVPWNYPKLSNKTSATSPFTIVFQLAGSKGAGSFMNAVIITSIISSGNHAVFSSSRFIYSLAKQGQAPRIFAWKTRFGVPWVGVLAVWLISGLCFGSSFIGAGTLWSWLQSLVGVTHQLAWLAIGIAAIRFRKGMQAQGKVHLLKYKNWTHPWGPWVVVVGSTVIILVQGWSSFAPWSVSSFFSYYVELFIMPVVIIGWKLIKRTEFVRASEMDLETDTYKNTEEDDAEIKFYESQVGWRKWAYRVRSFFV